MEVKNASRATCIMFFTFAIYNLFACSSYGQDTVEETEGIAVTTSRIPLVTKTKGETPTFQTTEYINSTPSGATTNAVKFTSSPSPSFEKENLTIKIAYLQFVPAEPDPELSIWVLEDPLKTPKKVFEYLPRVGKGSEIAWSMMEDKLDSYKSKKGKVSLQ